VATPPRYPTSRPAPLALRARSACGLCASRWAAMTNASAASIARFRQRRDAGCGQAGHADRRWVDNRCLVLDNVEPGTGLEIQRPFAMAGCPRVERVREGRFASGRQGIASVGGWCTAWSSLRPVAAQHPLHPTAQAGRNHPPECGLKAALGFAAEEGRRG